jgi:hypothetical protein
LLGGLEFHQAAPSGHHREMLMIATVTLARLSMEKLQARFLTILKRIETHAKIYFRAERCQHKKADRVAETVALAWWWFVRMANKGKDATQFASVLASYAAKAVKSGRKVCGMEKAKDAMNERTQMKRGFVVGKLPDFSTLNTNPLAEALADNTRSPVPDQVAFRADFPAWQRTRTRRDRRLIREMAMGERTLDLAKRFKLSPARVSQLRNDFHSDWQRFTADPAEA